MGPCRTGSRSHAGCSRCPTPGAANTAPPVTGVDQRVDGEQRESGGYPDPVDGQYDDWFELYNPSAEAADISGLYLTDNLGNPTQWQIPAGQVIGPRGYKLVWADGQTSQNGRGRTGPARVVQPAGGGEAIGLYARKARTWWWWTR